MKKAIFLDRDGSTNHPPTLADMVCLSRGQKQSRKAVFLDCDGSTNYSLTLADMVCLPSLCFQPTQVVAENIK